jgi:hypothetical protein
MRRTLTALILGAAVLAAAMSPVAAGADPAPFFFKFHHERLHLACKAVRDADQPAVACKWELKSRPKPEPADPTTASDATVTATAAAVATPAPGPVPIPDPVPVAYRLWRATWGESRKVVFKGSDQSFVDTDVKPGTTYWYRAEALDSADQTVTWSNIQMVRVPRVPPEPMKLACEPNAALTVTSGDTPAPPGAPAVTCKWTAVDRPDLAGYRLWKGDREHRPHVVYKGKDTSFVDTDVVPGHRYGYLVQALNADGRPIGWGWISVAAVPPLPTPAPEPKAVDPPAPAAVPGVEHPVKPVEAHAESDDHQTPSPLPQPGSPASPPAPPTQDKPAHPPVEHPKPGPRPAERPVEHLRLACEPVKDAAGNAIQPVSVACKWTGSERAASYRLWRADRENKPIVVFEAKDATSYVDSGVSAGGTYGYWLQALDADGHVIGWSEPVKVAVPPAEAKKDPRPGANPKGEHRNDEHAN